jgi:hypothetical protein
MTTIPNPVHDTQHGTVKLAFAKVIFDQHIAASYSSRFSQQIRNTGRVVKNINKQTNINRGIGKWYMNAIKAPAFDQARGPQRHLKPTDKRRWAQLPNGVADRPIPATHV